ncbi:hypothetical protein Tco_0968485 [Tanacetum coccineum]
MAALLGGKQPVQSSSIQVYLGIMTVKWLQDTYFVNTLARGLNTSEINYSNTWVMLSSPLLKNSSSIDKSIRTRIQLCEMIAARWIPTGKLFDSCTSKVDSEPPHGSCKCSLSLLFMNDKQTLISYALSWKPCQGDSLNLPDHRVLVTPGSVVVTPGSVVVTPGSVVVTPGSVVVTPGSYSYSW